MKNPLPLIVVLLFAFVPFSAALAAKSDTGFDAVVHAIEGRYQVHATHLPMMGLVKMVAHHASHSGASDLHLAEIDNFTAPVDSEELTRLVEEKIGAGWTRMVRETHHRNSSETQVYIRPEGEQMGVFILDKSGREMDLVQVSVTPDSLGDTIREYTQRQSGDDERD